MVHTPRIGLVHHTSGGNLGDDATLAAVMQNIKARWPGAEIAGFPMIWEDPIRVMTFPFSHKPLNDAPAPLESKATLKVKIKTAVIKNRLAFRLLKAIYTVAIAVKAVLHEIPFLVKSFRGLRSFDLLILNAGGQLAESSGRPQEFENCPWKFSYTIFKWVLLARLARVKPIVLNLGAGPLPGLLSKGFFRSALSLTDGVFLRDEQSSARVRQIGFTGTTHVFPDSAYSRDVSALRGHHSGKRKDSVVGLAPMVFGKASPPLKEEDPVYTSFLQQLGLFASWLIRNDYCPTLFCTDMMVDPAALCGVTAIVRGDLGTADCNGSLDRVHQWSVEELLANMSSMDYVVTSRFHGVVFAHMLNIPVLAVSNHPTVRELMNDLGLSEYCVDIDKCNSSVLVDTFVSLVSNRDAVKSRMAEKLASYKGELSNQFDQLFPFEVSAVDRDETVIR